MKRSRDTDDENERRGGKAPRRGRWNGGRGGNNGGGARGFSSYNASQVQSWQRQFREPVLRGNNRQGPALHNNVPAAGPSNFNFPDADVFSHPSEQFRSALCPDPDHFYEVAKELAAQIPTEKIHTDPRHETLTHSIMQKYGQSQQTFNTMKKKIRLWKEIYRVVRMEFDCGLFIFGSTFNGFGGDKCDVDMCLFPQGARGYQDKQKLSIVRSLLRKHCSQFIRGHIELIPAKVPILKFQDKEGGLEVDLSVDNPTSIRNTHLLYYYSKCDYRVRPLVLAVKLWAKNYGINEARFQTLSSYALTVMVIHYLQYEVKPQVVPCLHDMYPQIFFAFSNIFSLNYLDAPNFRSQNTESTGKLLVGFFNYFANSFDPARDVASVRTGRILNPRDCEDYARREKLGPRQWTAKLLLEEPFDRTNVARAVCREERWNLVVDAFQSTSRYLESADVSKLQFDDILSINVDDD